MGFNLLETLGFSGGDAGSRAAAGAADFSRQGIEELRRQFGETQEMVQPFVQAGAEQLPALTAGATVGGLDERLAQIFGTDTFGALTEESERAVQGGLGAGGFTRSGFGLKELAAVPRSLGLQIEQMLTGRSGALAGAGQSAALGLGQLGAGAATGVANIFGQQGQQFASGQLLDAQAQAAANQNILDTAGRVAGVFFSDPALKENVKDIGFITDLTLHKWDWIPETKGTLVENCGTVGFLADEVKTKYPQHVDNFGGFMVIDYPALLDELEAA